jgi:hypothetical protein
LSTVWTVDGTVRNPNEPWFLNFTQGEFLIDGTHSPFL